MWNVYEEKFISNDTQHEVVLIIAGIIDFDYASADAKDLYNTLKVEEIEHIQKVLTKIKNVR
jgi:hypothetical protein